MSFIKILVVIAVITIVLTFVMRWVMSQSGLDIIVFMFIMGSVYLFYKLLVYAKGVKDGDY